MTWLPNIYLIGPMGAGKSTVGRQLADALQRDFYDSDQEVEARAGADIGWIFDIEGEAGFRERERKVIAELTELQNIVLATGGGAVTTKENRKLLSARGAVVYLQASLEEQYDRTRHTAKRPLLQTKNSKQKIDQLWLEREPLYEEIADLSIEPGINNVKQIVKIIIDQLSTPRL